MPMRGSLFKKLPFLLFSCICLSAVGKKLELPEFDNAPELPTFEKIQGPTAIKPITGSTVTGPSGPEAIKLRPHLPVSVPVPEAKDTALKAGDLLPNVTLTDPSGETINLPRYLFGKHAIIIFYHGNWSPYCNAHLLDIKSVEAPLLGLGYLVIAISPDKPTILQETIRELGPRYDLLSDSSMAAAKAFGLAYEVDDDMLALYKKNGVDLQEASGQVHHRLPKPAIYLISPEGVIRYTYRNDNFKHRIKADDLLEQANAYYRPVF